MHILLNTFYAEDNEKLIALIGITYHMLCKLEEFNNKALDFIANLKNKSNKKSYKHHEKKCAKSHKRMKIWIPMSEVNAVNHLIILTSADKHSP